MTESTEESTSMSPKEVVPPESGVSVADHGGDPGVFLAEVNKGLEQVVDAINRLLDVAVNWLNDHIDEIGTIGGGIAGTIVAGPVGGIVGAISGNHAAAAAQDRLAATFDKINRTWQEQVLPALRKAIGSMLGDPLKMAEIGQAYRNAVKVLGDATDTMSDSKIYESEFDGNAARAYDKVREAGECVRRCANRPVGGRHPDGRGREDAHQLLDPATGQHRQLDRKYR